MRAGRSPLQRRVGRPILRRMRRRLPWILLSFSVLLNVGFGVLQLVDRWNAPEDRVGVLTRDLEVGSFGGTNVIFSLPKGLTVRDASPRFLASIDVFEPHRFSVTMTTENEDLVNYQVDRSALRRDEELYSLDMADRRDDSPSPKN